MTAPEFILLEFIRANGDPVTLRELGPQFLIEMNVPSEKQLAPFQIHIEKKKSKAGNDYYDYMQNALPLPDGLNTYLRVQGAVIPMGKVRPSQNGHPTREGETQALVGAAMYKITAYITEGKTPFWVKVIAHKVPDSAGNIKKAQAAPRGGRVVL